MHLSAVVMGDIDLTLGGGQPSDGLVADACLRNHVFEILERTEFPSQTRKQVYKGGVAHGLVLGLVNQVGTASVSVHTKQHPELLAGLLRLFGERFPTTGITSFQVSKSALCEWHKDKSNLGPTHATVLENPLKPIIGGMLELRESGGGVEEVDLRGRWIKFPGWREHRTGRFEGTRYFIAAFTHMIVASAAPDVLSELKFHGFNLPTPRAVEFWLEYKKCAKLDLSSFPVKYTGQAQIDESVPSNPAEKLSPTQKHDCETLVDASQAGHRRFEFEVALPRFRRPVPVVFVLGRDSELDCDDTEVMLFFVSSGAGCEGWVYPRASDPAQGYVTHVVLESEPFPQLVDPAHSFLRIGDDALAAGARGDRDLLEAEAVRFPFALFNAALASVAPINAALQRSRGFQFCALLTDCISSFKLGAIDESIEEGQIYIWRETDLHYFLHQAVIAASRQPLSDGVIVGATPWRPARKDRAPYKVNALSQLFVCRFKPDTAVPAFSFPAVHPFALSEVLLQCCALESAASAAQQDPDQTAAPQVFAEGCDDALVQYVWRGEAAKAQDFRSWQCLLGSSERRNLQLLVGNWASASRGTKRRQGSASSEPCLIVVDP